LRRCGWNSLHHYCLELQAPSIIPHDALNTSRYGSMTGPCSGCVLLISIAGQWLTPSGRYRDLYSLCWLSSAIFLFVPLSFQFSNSRSFSFSRSIINLSFYRPLLSVCSPAYHHCSLSCLSVWSPLSFVPHNWPNALLPLGDRLNNNGTPHTTSPAYVLAVLPVQWRAFHICPHFKMHWSEFQQQAVPARHVQQLPERQQHTSSTDFCSPPS